MSEPASISDIVAPIMAAFGDVKIVELPPEPVKPSREKIAERGVPERHIRAVFDREPIECKPLELVRKFLASDRDILVLSGTRGTRKSGSACWALTQRAGLFVTANDLSRIARSRAEDVQRKERLTHTCALLVIDDLGTEYNDDKGWFTHLLNDVVNDRYSNCLKTILVTNLEPERFKTTYGERVADRIRECGTFETIGGASVRGRKP